MWPPYNWSTTEYIQQLAQKWTGATLMRGATFGIPMVALGQLGPRPSRRAAGTDKSVAWQAFAARPTAAPWHAKSARPASVAPPSPLGAIAPSFQPSAGAGAWARVRGGDVLGWSSMHTFGIW